MAHHIIIIVNSKAWCGVPQLTKDLSHGSTQSVRDDLVWQQKGKDVSSQVKDLGQICCCYESVALAVENSKSLANFLLDVGIFELPDLSRSFIDKRTNVKPSYLLAPFEVMVWFENFAIVGLLI